MAADQASCIFRVYLFSGKSAFGTMVQLIMMQFSTLAARYCLVFFSCRSKITAATFNEKSGRLALFLVLLCGGKHNRALSASAFEVGPTLLFPSPPLDLDSLPNENTTQGEGESGRQPPLVHQRMRSSILQRDYRTSRLKHRRHSVSRSVLFAVKDITEFPHPSSFEHHSNQLELTQICQQALHSSYLQDTHQLPKDRNFAKSIKGANGSSFTCICVVIY
ncbi:hypothetical protein DEU56DRAFT_121736 [Suillus clintonianus]|uniref:uncharacterized protein n=1 Tax=Suillus clintonianus TaxID=1904413 RepID=UPI001B883B43|nr:uncharacterized protein DEU56DRAFT_121736 [Suillus clintonianus]KAG2119402.1 hypothetical protein DEU56DRAFT_121736 [Suillus clintonianus]